MTNQRIQKCLLLLFAAFIPFIIAVFTCFAQADNWIYKAKMPTTRTFLGASIVADKFYVIGGTSAASASSVVEMYDPLTNTWTKKANMPSARCYPVTCAFNGKIYVFGGSAGMWTASNKNIYLYDPQTDTWTQKADMPYAVGGSGVASVDSTIYLIGGGLSASSQPISTVMAYDPIAESWTQKADMPTPRNMLSACVIDGKIYAIGGTTEKWESISYQHVEVYDPATDTWTRKADMPTGRWGLAACVINGLLYAVGGRAGYYSCSINEVYDPIADTWSAKTPMQQVRTGLVAGVVGDKIYATGGHEGPPLVVQSSLEEYNPDLTNIDFKSEFLSQPKQYLLYQNYPNPFNASTTIRYSLHKPNFVALQIYNVHGEKIANSGYESKAAGDHYWILNTSALPGGVYFYTLQIGSAFFETRKMLVVK
jgi:hypothetical protein